MKLEEIQSTGKGVRYIHNDPTPATRFMKGKSNGHNFSLKKKKKLTHGNKYQSAGTLYTTLLIKTPMQDVPYKTQSNTINPLFCF